MKRSKNQRGITLVALIITMVVLLILAVVAISSIQKDGIIAHGNNATASYNQAQKNEQDILEGYMNFFNDANKVKEIEFTINNTTYKALEGMTWSEWCDSSYNTIGLKVSFEVIVTDNYESSIKYSKNDYGVGCNETILNGESYELSEGAGA